MTSAATSTIDQILPEANADSTYSIDAFRWLFQEKRRQALLKVGNPDSRSEINQLGINLNNYNSILLLLEEFDGSISFTGKADADPSIILQSLAKIIEQEKAKLDGTIASAAESSLAHVEMTGSPQKFRELFELKRRQAWDNLGAVTSTSERDRLGKRIRDYSKIVRLLGQLDQSTSLTIETNSDPSALLKDLSKAIEGANAQIDHTKPTQDFRAIFESKRAKAIKALKPLHRSTDEAKELKRMVAQYGAILHLLSPLHESAKYTIKVDADPSFILMNLIPEIIKANDRITWVPSKPAALPPKAASKPEPVFVRQPVAKKHKSLTSHLNTAWQITTSLITRPIKKYGLKPTIPSSQRSSSTPSSPVL